MTRFQRAPARAERRARKTGPLVLISPTAGYRAARADGGKTHMGFEESLANYEREPDDREMLGTTTQRICLALEGGNDRGHLVL